MQPVQRGNGLVLDRLDGNRVHLLVPIGFKKPFRVGAVGLTAPHVWAHIMRGQQPDGMTEWVELPHGRRSPFHRMQPTAVLQSVSRCG